MPTNPNIALSVRPPQIDDVGEKILTLRNMAQQQQAQQQEQQIRSQQMEMNTLQLASQKRAAAAVDAVSAAIKQAKGDLGVASKILVDGGFAQEAMDLDKAHMATATSALAFQSARQNFISVGQERLGDLAVRLQGELKGGASRGALLAHLAVAANDGLVPEDQARTMLAQLSGQPTEQIVSFLDQYVTPTIRAREADIAGKTATAAKTAAEVAGTLPETPSQKSTRLMAEAHLRLAQRADARAEKAANPFGVAANGQAVAGPTGDAYLKTLAPNIANEVKAYAEGKRPFPTGMAYAKLQPLIAMVSQYDPSFDAGNYNARNKTRTDLTSPSGTGGKTINALNTAIQHGGKLSDLIEALDNLDKDPTHILGVQNANAIKNWWNNREGSTKVTNFEAVAPQLAKEIERAWRGAGGSAGEIAELKESIGKNLGKQQQREALYNFVELAKGKLDATETQRDNALGPIAGKDIPILFEQNKKIIDTITQRADGASAAMRKEIPGHPGQFAVSKDGGKTWTAE